MRSFASELLESLSAGFDRSASEVTILPQIDAPQWLISTMALWVSVFHRPITVSAVAGAPASKAPISNRDMSFLSKHRHRGSAVVLPCLGRCPHGQFCCRSVSALIASALTYAA